MIKEKVYCNVLKTTINKDERCPDWNCNNCPELASSKDIFTTPKNFSEVYLQYLSGQGNFVTEEGEPWSLPFGLTEIHRLCTLETEYLKILDKRILAMSKDISQQCMAKLNKLDSAVKTKILVALYDLSMASMMEDKLKRSYREGQKERKKHLKAVNILLDATFLSPDEKDTLLNIRSLLNDLEKPMEYSPVSFLEAFKILSMRGKKSLDDKWWYTHDMYYLTHKNVNVKPIKPYKFFQKSLQIVIWRLLVNEGRQKKEDSKHFVANLCNSYFKSSLDGEYKHLATLTYKTVDNAIHP